MFQVWKYTHSKARKETRCSQNNPITVFKAGILPGKVMLHVEKILISTYLFG